MSYPQFRLFHDCFPAKCTRNEISSITNTPTTAWNWASPHSKHGNFETVYCHFHGSSGLYLLKLISISLVWIHDGCVVCIWTHLDPFVIPNTPTRAWNWPCQAHTAEPKTPGVPWCSGGPWNTKETPRRHHKSNFRGVPSCSKENVGGKIIC
jgi:hypothetical protein